MAFWNRKRKRKQTASVTHVVNNFGPRRDDEKACGKTENYVNVYSPPVVPLFQGVDTSTPSRDADCSPSHESYTSHDSGGSYDGGSSYDSGGGSDGGSCGSD